MQTELKKTLRIGTIPGRGNLFIKVEVTGGKLSISGVEGPMSNGDARGSCGQISMGYARRNPAHNDRRYSEPIKPDQIQFAPGWTADKWLDLLEVWHDWHLNDMKPNCQHQTGPDWDTSKEITLYYFRLSQEAESKIKAAKERAKVGFMTGQAITPTAEETELFKLQDRITHHADTLPEPLQKWYVPNGPVYPGDHYNKASEVKNAGWVHPEEHPAGLFCKPCPVCGYKYGSAWRCEPLPDSVLSFLASLPETDKEPAWV